MRGGRGFSGRGGRGGSSYRPSSGSYNGGRMGSDSRKSDYGGGYGSSSRSYNSNYHNNSSSYNSRDRFSNRHSTDRPGVSTTYKRPFTSSSTTRDRSDDRKRSRNEDSRMNSSYSSSSTTPYRRSDTNRRPVGSPDRQERGSSSTYRGHRDDSLSHRHSSVHDSMGPPKRPTTTRLSSTYTRGVPSRSTRGAPIKRGGATRIIHRHNNESTDLRIMRRKLLLANQRDRARMLKIAKLTSSLRKRRDPPLRKSSTSRKSRSDRKSDDDEEDEEEEDDDDDKADSKSDKSKLNSSKDEGAKSATGGDAGSDDDEIEKADESKKGEDEEEDEEEAADGDDAKEIKKEGKTKSHNDGDEKEKADGEAKSKGDGEGKETYRRRRGSESPSPRKKNFIKLTCVHCRTKCFTFKEYANHLAHSRFHKQAMRRIAIRQRGQLTRMRTAQRHAQRKIEENSETNLDDIPQQFCLLCRLNYRQNKAKHQLSEHHKNMKKFLMPYCSTCHIAFKSPMVYEAHRCSLEHIKNKARNNESNSESSDGEREVDLNNFLTVDSVGEIDDIENCVDMEVTEDENKEKAVVGAQYVKKTEAFFCELCRAYYPCKDDEETFVKKHCVNRSHLKAYIRHKEDVDLQAKAERVEKKEKESKKKVEPKVKEEKVKTEEEKQGGEGEEDHEDKMWEDVDKDLGDLLREVAPDDDEEDESVLNIDIASEKPKSKEVNGKAKDDVVADKDKAADDEKEDSPKKKEAKSEKAADESAEKPSKEEQTKKKETETAVEES